MKLRWTIGTVLALAGVSACGGDTDNMALADAGVEDAIGPDASGADAMGQATSYSQSFTGADGDPWPAEWQIPQEGQSPLTDSSIQGNRAYLEGIVGAAEVTRMVMSTFQARDFEATFTIQFSDFANQGIGFYGRQNGGRLMGTTVPGQGYAVFIEGYTHGGTDLNLTLWHELNGDEVREVAQRMSTLVASNSVVYRVRFRLEQSETGTSTLLQARMWQDGLAEPADYQVTRLSTISDNAGLSVLQDISGGFAIDVYNSSATNGVFIDEIELVAIAP